MISTTYQLISNADCLLAVLVQNGDDNKKDQIRVTSLIIDVNLVFRDC